MKYGLKTLDLETVPAGVTGQMTVSFMQGSGQIQVPVGVALITVVTGSPNVSPSTGSVTVAAVTGTGEVN